MRSLTEDATSVRKAAIVLAALGEDLAQEVCAALPVGQVLALGEELSSLREVPTEELNAVLDEFLELSRNPAVLGGPAYARALLDSTLGTVHTASLQEAEGLTLLSQLNDLEAAVLWRVLRSERNQTVAAVLIHLTATRAGQLLSCFDEARAADIAYRAAHLASPSPGAMQALARSLDLELQGVQGRSSGLPEVSLQFVVDLIGSMPPAKGKLTLAALQEVDREFGEGVAEQVFTFEDIVKLSDADLQRVLRNIDMSILVLALKGTPAELREQVKANLSQRGRERLDEEMGMLGAVPLHQVQEAQRQVCHELRALAEAGEIRLDSGDTEYVE